MSDGSKPSPELTGVRLKFKPSNELETRIRFFLNAQAQELVRKNSGRIKLISRRVRYLDLGVGSQSTGKDTNRFEGFSRKIDSKTNIHTFQLGSKVVIDEEVDDGIELKFNIDFANDVEKALIVEAPFMTRTTRTPFEIYAAIPQKALGTPEAVEQASELLGLSMRPIVRNDDGSAPIAPWEMNVRDAEIDRIPPQLSIVENLPED